MIIDCKKYAGACVCGQTHRVVTQQAVIEAGCMKNFDDLLAAAGLTGRRAIIYDTNTYQAKGLVRPTAQQEIILPAEQLKADDGACATVLEQLTGNTEVLVAVGAGTIHDIAKYCAHKLGLPLVSCPTAASVDGYASNRCSMHWQGAPVQTPGTAPTLVLADLDVISRAPQTLARAGIGEGISKFTALADWKIANLLNGTEGCAVIESLLRQSAIAAQGACADLDAKGAYAQLMYALLLPGIATQMDHQGTASFGAEHMISQFIESNAQEFALDGNITHGELAGISAVFVSDLYHKLAEIDDIAPYLKAPKQIDLAWMNQHFGEPLATRLYEANTPDCLDKIDQPTLTSNWEEIRRIIAEIPSKEALTAMLQATQNRSSLDDLRISGAKITQLISLAPYMRNQLTLLRLLRMIKFRYVGNGTASLPARKRQHSEKSASSKKKAM